MTEIDIKKLNDKVLKLEESVKDLTIKIENIANINKNDIGNTTPQKIFNYEGKRQVNNVKTLTKKGEIDVTVNNDLNVLDSKGNVYIVGEELIVQNNLVMGDKLLVLTKEKHVQNIKVSQRAKRVREEALVTEKEGTFYAVSKFSTHKLINYDVLKRGVMKGFEIKILLPKDFEKKASTVLIDFVESSGGVSLKNENINEEKANIQPSIRVVEEDDLV